MTHAYNPRIQKIGNSETSLVYMAIPRSARVIQRGSISKHKGKNARQVVCPCDPQIWEAGIGRPQFEDNLDYTDVSYCKQNKKQAKPLIFYKENNSFKANLDVISVEMNGKWCVWGVPKISKCIHNTKAQVTASPNAQLTKRTLWRGKGRKANGIARETKGDIVAVPNLRARKGADCSGNVPWFQSSEIVALLHSTKGERPEAGGGHRRTGQRGSWKEQCPCPGGVDGVQASVGLA